MSKIDVRQMLIKMSDGNPGGLTAMIQLLKETESIDPINALGGVGNILQLDDMGIYGTDIYVLWSDICDRNTARLITVLRATQLGLISRETVINASSRQDYSGKTMIPIEDLYKQVKEELDVFDPNNLAFPEE